MLLVIDNYDSFTWNLVHYLGELGAAPTVVRNDKITPEEALDRRAEAIILSPGPCTPDDAGICLDLVRMAGGTVPILGVCLGHQTVGQSYGAEIVRAPTLMHGKLSRIIHEGDGIFRGINGSFQATRYHSLTIRPETIPESLIATARTEEGVIMGVRHRTHPVHGLQFHPESIASECGHTLLRNFLDIARAFNDGAGRVAA